MKYSNDIDGIDFYLVGSCICFAAGGEKTGAFLLVCAMICYVGKQFLKSGQVK